MDITDAQWAVVGPLLPKPKVRKDGRGRPWKDSREVMNGVLWVLRTGAPWKDLPERYPPYQTCHRRFQAWNRSVALRAALRALAQDLEERGGIDVSECFIDGTFSAAKKGAVESGKPSAEKAPRSWPLQTALVFLSPYAREALRRTK